MSESTEVALRLNLDIALDPILTGPKDLNESCNDRLGASRNGLTRRLFQVLLLVPALAASIEIPALSSLRPASLEVVSMLELML